MTWYGMRALLLRSMVGRIFAFWARLIDVSGTLLVHEMTVLPGDAACGFQWFCLSMSWVGLVYPALIFGPFSEGGLFGDRAPCLVQRLRPPDPAAEIMDLRSALSAPARNSGIANLHPPLTHLGFAALVGRCLQSVVGRNKGLRKGETGATLLHDFHDPQQNVFPDAETPPGRVST